MGIFGEGVIGMINKVQAVLREVKQCLDDRCREAEISLQGQGETSGNDYWTGKVAGLKEASLSVQNLLLY